jgi:hypothetical protein
MAGLKRSIREERGAAMVLVVILGGVLSLLGLLLITLVSNESNRSAQAVVRGAAFQAAEAAIDDYIAKLVDDPVYYSHFVHPGEATREEPGGGQVSAGSDGTAADGSPWTYDLTWTYPNGTDTWRALPNGYEYSLQVTPPSAGSLSTKIVATGRKQGSTTDVRRVETLVRPSSLADFYRVVNGDVAWGSGATTNGKIYANGDIDHDGTATANMYAEDDISGSYTLQNGAQAYDSTTIRSQIPEPINFANFLTSFVDVQRAADLGGIYLDDPSKAGWRLIFQANGSVDVQSCTLTGGDPLAETAPTCGATTNYAMPANGAIYAAQTAVVSGQVNGRVTVASNDEIVLAGNISYVSASDDVLGLACVNDFVIAAWVPFNLTWSGSVLSQSGTWRTYLSDGSHGTMNFSGSAATESGGNMTMFDFRNYGYNSNLLFLPPPWFPTVGEAYTIALFRELPAS